MNNPLDTTNDKTKHTSKDGPSIEVLRITVEEQRREYDILSDSKHRVANKTLTLTGAGLALLTFLYADGEIFIPTEIYGQIFYTVGALLNIGALATLLFATKPSGTWELPPEIDTLESLDEKDERKYLEYIKNRYITCYKSNAKHYQTKQRLMNMSFYPLVFGAIILIIIKLFGGQ